MIDPKAYPFLDPELVAEVAEGSLSLPNAIERFKGNGLSQGESMIGLVVLFHLSVAEAKRWIATSSAWNTCAAGAMELRQAAYHEIRHQGPMHLI